jgi:phage terminase small subunit
MPNPRKPTPLKVVAGTARADREPASFVDLPLVDEIPLPPDWLPNAHATKEWERLAPILVANRLLTEAGTVALAHLCAMHGKVVQLYAAGEAPNASMVAQLRGLANDFGLTPVSQGKVRPAGDERRPGNKFGALGKPGEAG